MTLVRTCHPHPRSGARASDIPPRRGAAAVEGLIWTVAATCAAFALCSSVGVGHGRRGIARGGIPGLRWSPPSRGSLSRRAPLARRPPRMSARSPSVWSGSFRRPAAGWVPRSSPKERASRKRGSPAAREWLARRGLRDSIARIRRPPADGSRAVVRPQWPWRRSPLPRPCRARRGPPGRARGARSRDLWEAGSADWRVTPGDVEVEYGAGVRGPRATWERKRRVRSSSSGRRGETAWRADTLADAPGGARRWETLAVERRYRLRFGSGVSPEYTLAVRGSSRSSGVEARVPGET